MAVGVAKPDAPPRPLPAQPPFLTPIPGRQAGTSNPDASPRPPPALLIKPPGARQPLQALIGGSRAGEPLPLAPPLVLPPRA